MYWERIASHPPGVTATATQVSLSVAISHFDLGGVCSRIPRQVRIEREGITEPLHGQPKAEIGVGIEIGV